MTSNKKVVLITGAARGIGAATAKTFASSGHRVAALDVLQDQLAETTHAIVGAGGEAEPFVVDLTDLDGLERVVGTIAERWGRIDVLINNAASRNLESVRTITPDAWNHVLAVNLTAPAFLTKWVTPHMRSTASRPQGGVIINIASVEAHIPKGVAAAYAATKGALISLTHESAASLAGLGIRVVVISPGAIDTPFGADYTSTAGSQDESPAENMRMESEQVIPMRRWGTTKEIADAALWLAGEGASYITGCEIKIDGGLTQTWMPHRVKRQILPHEFE